MQQRGQPVEQRHACLFDGKLRRQRNAHSLRLGLRAAQFHEARREIIDLVIPDVERHYLSLTDDRRISDDAPAMVICISQSAYSSNVFRDIPPRQSRACDWRLCGTEGTVVAPPAKTAKGPREQTTNDNQYGFPLDT